MSYDRADWHYGGIGFAPDLPPEAGGTHIGMFLAWAFMKGLEGEDHRREAAEAVEALRRREITGRQYLFEYCDEKLTANELNEEGNAFAAYYYGEGEKPGMYLKDYEETLGLGHRSTYHVEDTWENFDTIASVIDERFESWTRRRARPWWRFW